MPIALFSLPLGPGGRPVGRRGSSSRVCAGRGGIGADRRVPLARALIAARGIQGIGSAASWISALALVSDTAPPGRRGESIGAALAATGVGSIAGPALGGVAADVLSYEAPFLIVAAIALALARGAALLRPARGAPAGRPRAGVVVRTLRAGHAVWAAAITLVSAGVLGLMEVVAPLDLDERLGLSASAIGLLFAASIAVDAACHRSAGAGVIARRPGPPSSGWA